MIGMQELINVLVSLLIFGVLYWGIQQIAGVLGLPAVIITVIRVFLVVAFVIYLLKLLGLFAGIAVG